MKRQPTEWEKIFTDDLINKGLTYKYINNSYSSTTEQQTTWLKNKQKNLKKKGRKTEQTFFPKEACRWPIDTWKETYH